MHLVVIHTPTPSPPFPPAPVLIFLSVFLSPAMALYDSFSSPAAPRGGRHQEIPSLVALLPPPKKNTFSFVNMTKRWATGLALGRSPWTLP